MPGSKKIPTCFSLSRDEKEKLAALCEREKRKPSGEVAFLIEKEYKNVIDNESLTKRD